MIPLVKSDGKRKAPKFYPMILRRGDFLVAMMGLQEDTFLCSLGMEMYPHKIPQPSKMNAAESLRSTVTRALVYECFLQIRNDLSKKKWDTSVALRITYGVVSPQISKYIYRYISQLIWDDLDLDLYCTFP